jgi:hypothetical protein
VLRECGVVTSVRRGKSQNFALDARPFAAIRDSWLAGFAEMQSASLAALRNRVEARSGSRDVRKSKHKSKVKK